MQSLSAYPNLNTIYYYLTTKMGKAIKYLKIEDMQYRQFPNIFL